MVETTWDQLRQLQRRLAGWTEDWFADQHEVYTKVNENGRPRRVHLGWVQSAELASLIVDLHNRAGYLMNALVMYRKMESDKGKDGRA